MPNSRHRSGVSEEGLEALGRRLAAAYVSYVSGRKGVDRTLRESPERVGRLWIDLADILYCAMGAKVSEDDLQFREVITKYIQ